MAEHDIEEKIESLRQIQMEIGPCEVITGGRDKNPVLFLLQSGKGLFVRKEGYVLALKPQLYRAVEMDGFSEQMKDVIDYRTMYYYRKRYEGKTE